MHHGIGSPGSNGNCLVTKFGARSSQEQATVKLQIFKTFRRKKSKGRGLSIVNVGEAWEKELIKPSQAQGRVSQKPARQGFPLLPLRRGGFKTACAP